MCQLRCCYDNGVPDARNSFAAREFRTVFLDRDGVINEKMPEGHYVRSSSEFHLLPGVPEAIARLNQAGLRVVVVTNQRGVALGLYSLDDVAAIHQHLQSMLAAHGAHIDAFFFCPHDKGACGCRKPQTGLFDEARACFPDIDPETSVMIGDSLSDIEFGRKLGMRTIFIEGEPERRKAGSEKAAELADLRSPSLAAAIEALFNDLPPGLAL